MRRYIVTSIVLVLLALAFFVYPQRLSTNSLVVGQKRPAPRVPAPQAGRKAIDYNKTPFSHTSRKEHQDKCETCHDKVPTKNWETVKHMSGVPAFPDVANFPDHAACVRCHRAQFFKGAQPGICLDCHKKTVSPKNGDTLDFLAPVHPSQFALRFTHDAHQDALATAQPVDDKGKVIDEKGKINNCDICHLADTVKPTPKPAGWKLTVPPLAFKASPQGHESCFGCHWSGQSPTKEDCAGCHQGAPLAAFKRISPPFIHNRADHVKECTACHINITKSATLRGLKADVPLSTCLTCHNKKEPERPEDGRYQRVVKKEMQERTAALAKNTPYACIYCHDKDDKGKIEPPADHYHAIGKEAPKKDQK